MANIPTRFDLWAVGYRLLATLSMFLEEFLALDPSRQHARA